MGDINSATTPNTALLKSQQATLNQISNENSEILELLRDLLQAIKEITDK